MSPIEPLDDFVGRRDEVVALDRHYATKRSAFVPVYGRRRIGKTELILRFLDAKPGVYFAASNKLREPQIADFMRAAAAWLKVATLAETAPTSWESALRVVVGAAPKGKKLVIALDEFQWLCEASPELPSVLQRLWDLEWQRTNAVMLVLCGSFIGFMEREVLGARSPLHGRRTGDLHLQPFGFREAADFHPAWSRAEQARAYFVCGGVPAYLRRFDPRLSVVQNVTREFFDIDGFFQREPEFLLREELAEVKHATSILEVIALGRRSQGDIARGVGLTTAALAPHLKNLVALGYLERTFPLMPGRAPRVSVVYRVADPLLRFWFRFIEPHWSTLRRTTAARNFEQLVRPHWESFCGEGFERMCREAMSRIYAQEGISGRYDVGEYWDRGVQIDVVGLRSDGWVDLGECRWQERPSIASIADELAARAAKYPAGGRTIRPHVFVPSRGRSERTDVAVHDLSELYGGPPPRRKRVTKRS